MSVLIMLKKYVWTDLCQGQHSGQWERADLPLGKMTWQTIQFGKHAGAGKVRMGFFQRMRSQVLAELTLCPTPPYTLCPLTLTGASAPLVLFPSWKLWLTLDSSWSHSSIPACSHCHWPMNFPPLASLWSFLIIPSDLLSLHLHRPLSPVR